MRHNYSRRMRFEELESRSMLAVLFGDYDLNGAVAENDFTVWRAHFGEIGELPMDGNGDGIVDGADYTVWRDNLNNTLADLPIGPHEISAAATGATSIRVDWQSVASATSYAVQRRQPDTETDFTTLAPSIAGTSYTDNTATTNTLYEYRVVAQNGNGIATPSQTAQATAGRSNLTAFRPQSIQDFVNPIDEPIYAPFVKRPVREQDEQSSTLGPGIRINWDHDSGGFLYPDAFQSGYEIPLENDLIEVKVDRLPGQGNLVLSAGSKLALYFNHDKETPIPLTGGTSAPLSFTGNTITVFVEWVDDGHGTDNLRLVDPATSTTLDTIRFHSFTSLTIVFGGRTQNPTDTDGDGSIGDVVEGTNREGIFDLAQTLYDTGWDVMAFDSTDADIYNVVNVAQAEIWSAMNYRFLSQLDGGTGFAVMGYSWGGGATHDLIEGLYDSDMLFPAFAVYLDAVEHGALSTNAPQNEWPNETLYLLNIWQPNPTLEYGGAAIYNPEDMSPFSTLEEVDVVADWGLDLDHYSIDDNLQVQQLIRTRLGQIMLR